MEILFAFKIQTLYFIQNLLMWHLHSRKNLDVQKIVTSPLE